uniref:Uncharacterized protein MANES_02G003700 n=1 Tax=Rhizophora mucronata TaxID=61149 RepID=A0A2P2JHK0_RHIMU
MRVPWQWQELHLNFETSREPNTILNQDIRLERMLSDLNSQFQFSIEYFFRPLVCDQQFILFFVSYSWHLLI